VGVESFFLGRYWELEAENFFDRIKLKNTSKLLTKNPWTIFGPWVFLSHYWELEAENFFDRIKLKNTSKLLIKNPWTIFGP
jgi:hypothetical protein